MVEQDLLDELLLAIREQLLGRQAQLGQRALEGALERIQQDSLPRANGVLEAEERGLREGQLDITDLLLVRREAIALRLHALDLHFELFTVRNELRQALGLDEALAQR